MVDALLDTDILVDWMKNYPPALNWASANAHLRFGVPVIAWLELVQGATSKLEQQRAIKVLNKFEPIQLASNDGAWAMSQFPTAYLVHGVGILDVLIASIAVRLQLPLYTRNIRHFSRLPDIQVFVPY